MIITGSYDKGKNLLLMQVSTDFNADRPLWASRRPGLKGLHLSFHIAQGTGTATSIRNENRTAFSPMLDLVGFCLFAFARVLYNYLIIIYEPQENTTNTSEIHGNSPAWFRVNQHVIPYRLHLQVRWWAQNILYKPHQTTEKAIAGLTSSSADFCPLS